ncbi:MAG: hypothetical protein NTNFB02_15520 [Nitrospira sp.]
MKSLIDMLNRTADGALLVNEDGKVVLWNKAAERLLGFRAREVIGRDCHEVMRGETLSGHPFCSASCLVGHRLGCGGGVRNFDIQTSTKSGKPVWLNVSSLPIPSRKQERFLFAHLFRDIGKQAKVRRLVNELQSVLSSLGGQVAEAQPARAPASFLNEAPDIPPSLPLSRREREVLQHLAQGERTARIADALCISTVTVRNHIQHIFDKLGAHSRVEALAVAFHHPMSSS